MTTLFKTQFTFILMLFFMSPQSYAHTPDCEFTSSLERFESCIDYFFKNKTYGDNKRKSLLLWEAIKRNSSKQTINKLIQAGADTSFENGYGDTALSVAIYENNEKAVSALISAGADINLQNTYNENTALHVAAKFNREKILSTLISAGADINLKNTYGNTALHVAVYEDNRIAVSTLISAGADINLQNDYGNTALHLAAKKPNSGAVLALISAGADINLQNDYGNTALHLAAKEPNRWRSEWGKKLIKSKNYRRNKKMILSALISISAGADINLQNEYGNTALHRAVLGGNEKAVSALISAGAELNIQNEEGETALSLAAKKDETEILQSLISAGAEEPSGLYYFLIKHF